MEYVSGKAKKVVLYIGGESTFREKSVISGSCIELAKREKAAIYGLEHRFFGESMPFDELTSQNLAYLTIDQALYDLAAFIDFIKSLPTSAEDISFVVVGGSYPGSLSSWFRLKFPHLTVASWSSSAPLHIKNDFTEYDSYVADQLKLLSPKCLNNTRKIFEKAHQRIASGNPQEIADLKHELSVLDTQDDVSTLYVMTDVLAAAVQYNSRYNLLSSYCYNQENSDDGNYTAFIEMYNNLLKTMGSTPLDFDLLEQTNTSSKSPIANGRSWSWMTCNEVGWFQTNSNRLRSSFLNLSYFNRVCKTLFNLDELADEAEVNRRYGGQNPRQTRVFFLNGAVDPWSTLSVHVPDESIERFSIVIPDESHCADLYPLSDADRTPLKNAKQAVINQISKWWNEPICNGTCKNGVCLAGRCVCNKGYGGDICDIQIVDKYYLDVAIICGVSIPVVSVVIIILCSWIFVYRRRKINETPLLSSAQ